MVYDSLRRTQLEMLGHSKPKKNSTDCLYNLADIYKIKTKYLKKKDLICCIIKYEIENNNQVTIEDVQNYSEIYLKKENKLKLEVLCKQLKLTHNGSKRFLIQRIIVYKTKNIKIKLKEQMFIEKQIKKNGLLIYKEDNTIDKVILPNMVILKKEEDFYDNKSFIYFPEDFVNINKMLHFALHIKNLHDNNLHIQLNDTIVYLKNHEIKLLNEIYNKLELTIHINTISYTDYIQDCVDKKYAPKDVSHITNNLESIKYEGTDIHECNVCIENILNGQYITKLDCKHMFHTECINEWISRDNSCPCCRIKL